MKSFETINRNTPPAFRTVEKIEMIHAGEIRLPNNIPVYTINAGTQELVKLEFLFTAGMFQQSMPLQAAGVNALIEEGTSKLSAAEIADKVDYYGAFLETSLTQDTASVVLYTLNKHLANTLPVVEQVMKDAIFPQHELEIYLANRKQKFHVNNQKVASVARKQFSELLFGAKHPYGINVVETDFDTIKRNHLNDFYKRFYNSDTCKIIVSGKVDDAIIQLLSKHFGGNDWKGNADFNYRDFIAQRQKLPINSSASIQQVIEKKDALQSAIRIGRVMFNKTHPDFHSMQVLNTVLGGYFGSRLMSNIREDKGYTYGIGSGMVSLHNSGYFFISTEVGSDVCKKALDEIYFEINRLKEEEIEEEELKLVKNYLLGRFLRSVDGPFSLAERFKSIMEYNLGYDYYDKFIATIKGIQASELKELANRYWNKESMIELVVGKK